MAKAVHGVAGAGKNNTQYHAHNAARKEQAWLVLIAGNIGDDQVLNQQQETYVDAVSSHCAKSVPNLAVIIRKNWFTNTLS